MKAINKQPCSPKGDGWFSVLLVTSLVVALHYSGLLYQTLPFPGPKGPVAAGYTNCYPVTIPDASISATLTNYPLLFRSPTGTINAVSAAGLSTLTVATGDSFPSWFDNTMSVAITVSGTTTIYPISSRTSGSILVITGTTGTLTGQVWNGTPYLSYGITGSKVLNSSGYDIGFFSDSGCTSKLNWETETWAATGIGVWWVQKTLTDGGTTTLYVGYGNSAISTDQSNKTGTWDSNYILVHHLPDGTSLTGNDSTSNANNGTITAATATAGEVDGGGSFNGTTAKDVITQNSGVNSGGDFTASIWMKSSSCAGGGSWFNGCVLFNKNTAGSAENSWAITIVGGVLNCVVRAEVNTGTTSVNDNAWRLVGCSRNGTTGSKTIYVNGSGESTSGTETQSATNTQNLNVGGKTGEVFFPGSLDEVRFSNSIRAAAWWAADFASQGSPFTFWSTTAH